MVLGWPQSLQSFHRLSLSLPLTCASWSLSCLWNQS